MYKKVISVEGNYNSLHLRASGGESEEPIEFILRGPGGAMGYTTLELIAAAQKLDRRIIGGKINLHFLDREEKAFNQASRLQQKLDGKAESWAYQSHFPYSKALSGMRSLGDNRVEMLSRFGNFPATMDFIPDHNRDISAINKAIASGRRVLLFDTTGMVDFAHAEQSPRDYLDYPGLFTFLSAPAKGAKPDVPHTLMGSNLIRDYANSRARWRNSLDLTSVLDPAQAVIVANGSCSTHFVASVYNALITLFPNAELRAHQEHLDHSRTNTDGPEALRGNAIPGESGVSKALLKIFPDHEGLKNGSTTSPRLNVDGSSYASLSFTFKSDQEITTADLLAGLRNLAATSMTEHLGVMTEQVAKDKKYGGAHNKKSFPVNSMIGLKGFLTTAIIDPTNCTVLPLGDGLYTIVIRGYYDNVIGYLKATLDEMSLLARLRWNLGHDLYPTGAKAIWELTRTFSAVNNSSPFLDNKFGFDLSDRRRHTLGRMLETQPAAGYSVEQ